MLISGGKYLFVGVRCRLDKVFKHTQEKRKKKKFTERQGKGKDRCTFSPQLIFAVKTLYLMSS